MIEIPAGSTTFYLAANEADLKPLCEGLSSQGWDMAPIRPQRVPLEGRLVTLFFTEATRHKCFCGVGIDPQEWRSGFHNCEHCAKEEHANSLEKRGGA